MPLNAVANRAALRADRACQLNSFPVGLQEKAAFRISSIVLDAQSDSILKIASGHRKHHRRKANGKRRMRNLRAQAERMAGGVEEAIFQRAFGRNDLPEFARQR